jgi:DUF4097 and DUF4098 domain-containing protein YvlB
MKTVLKILLLIFFVGLIMIAVGFATGHDMQGLPGLFTDDDRYGELLSNDITETIDSIHLDLDVRNVIITLTDDENITYSYHAHELDTWTHRTDNNRLEVKQTRRMSFNFGFFRRTSSEYLDFNLYLPNDFNQTLYIETAVGKIELIFDEMHTFQNIDIKTATGKIVLENVKSVGNFNVETKTGDLQLKHVEGNDIFVEVSTGRILTESVQANNLDLKNSTGRIVVEDSNITNKLKVRNSTGDIIIKSTEAATFDLVLSTGNIDAYFDNIDDIKFDLETSTGSITVFGNNQSKRYNTQTGTIIFDASASTGRIRIIEND